MWSQEVLGAFQAVSESFRGFHSIGFQRVSEAFQGVPKEFQGHFRRFLRVSRTFHGASDVFRFSRFQGVFVALQGISGDLR